jgi:hypothetical protein
MTIVAASASIDLLRLVDAGTCVLPAGAGEGAGLVSSSIVG